MKTLILKHLPKGFMIIIIATAIACLASSNAKTLKAEETVGSDKSTYKSIESKLDSLKHAPKQTDLNPGAKCYKVAFDRDSLALVCTGCGKSTMYPSRRMEEIMRLKQGLEGFKSIPIKVDNSNLCRHCNKTPKYIFNLSIIYPDKKKPITSSISIDEAKVLLQFLQGNKVYSGSLGRESDMKDYIEMLRKVLLGK